MLAHRVANILRQHIERLMQIAFAGLHLITHAFVRGSRSH